MLFYTLDVEYYSTPNYCTEQNSVLFSTCISVFFSISISVLDVVINDTERCSVLLGIFSALSCVSIYIYIYGPCMCVMCVHADVGGVHEGEGR